MYNKKWRVMMKPRIEKAKFGSITVGNEKFDHDILIRLNGRVEKRKKKLSKEIYGTSHTISRDEARHVYEEGATRLIVGGGHMGSVKLSDEAAAFFSEHGCDVEIYPIPEVIKAWNKASGKCIGLFHVTC